MKKHKLDALAKCTLISSLALTSAYSSAEAIEEVTVKGEFRQYAPIDIANSVSVFTDKALEMREAEHLEDLFNLAPNVNYSAGASRGRYIQVRGIGERSEYSHPVNPSVGVVVDGIDFTGISTGVTGLDIAQVEVFRGPQGTLYGANALAGLIYVSGKTVEDELGGKIKAGIGNYNTKTLSGVINAPLNEDAGVRFAIKNHSSDGYMRNAYLNTDDTNNIDETTARLAASLKVTDKLALDLVTYLINVDNGYDAFSLDNTRTTLSDQPGHDTQDTLAAALKANYQLSDSARWETTLSFADSETEYGYDEDWAYRVICPQTSDCAYNQYSSTDNYERENENLSLDSRIASKNAASEFGWVAGVYYRDQSVDLTRTYTNNDPTYSTQYGPITDPEIEIYHSDYSTENIALYGQLDFPLSPKLKLISGLRYEKWSSDFIDSDQAKFSPSENLWGGRLSLEYNTDNTLIYGLVSRGYKPGGFNPESGIPVEDRIYETETMWNYEIGSKTFFLDGNLELHTAIYYQDRDDVQAKQSKEIRVDGRPEFVEFYGNATSSKGQGVELELNWRANKSLLFYGSLGYQETEYGDYINPDHILNKDEGNLTVYNMKGRDLAHAPNYQYVIGHQIDISDHLYYRLEIEGKAEFVLSDSHNEESQKYNLLNLRIGYEINQLTISLWGKNLTNEDTIVRGFYFGNDPREDYAAEPYYQYGAPRTFGLTASYEF